MKYIYLIIFNCYLIFPCINAQINYPNLYPIQENGKYGLIDTSGNIVVEPRFDAISDCSEGRCIYVDYGEDMYKPPTFSGYTNYEGDIIIPAYYEFAFSFQEGKAIIFINDKPYFINKKGEVLFKVNSEICFSFSEGLAVFHKKLEDNKFVGAINHKNEIIFRLSGLALSSFDGMYATLVKEKFDNNNKKLEYFLVDKEGTIIKQLPNNCIGIFKDGLFPFTENGKYGFMNIEEEIIIPALYSINVYAGMIGFEENLCRVKKGDKWGYINKEGDVVIPFQYDFLCSFEGVLAKATKEGKIMYINKKGQIIYPKQP